MFPLLNLRAQVTKEASTNPFFQHLNASIIHFLNNSDDLDFTKYSWIQNPFMGEEDDEFGLISNEKENLIKLASDNSLNNIFRIYP